MNYILREYLGALPFYIFFGFLLAYFDPFGWAEGGPIWAHTLATVLGAYLWLTVWIVARTIWLTYKNRKERRNNG